jgi:hypothetical protein
MLSARDGTQDRQVPRHPDERHDFLRNIYLASGLSIRPKTHLSKIESLKEIIRAWGMNPDQILTKQAMTMPGAIVATEENQVQELSRALKE